jgi:sodium transport system permease protein
MNWRSVWLIVQREVKDQLRDRRTLFMVFVLPLLLYPLLGTSSLQLLQFNREHPTSVLVVGHEQLAGLPPLIEGDRFAAEIYAGTNWGQQRELTELILRPQRGPGAISSEGEPLPEALHGLRAGDYHAVICFPPGFAIELQALREQLAARTTPMDELQMVGPEIHYNSARKKSQVTYRRVRLALDLWRGQLVRENLQSAGVPTRAAQPFDITDRDVADQATRFAGVWSALFPFLMLTWAVTGAFYPAIDLCAGEKERGTLETLLASPAERSEIVVGKLLTVILFSLGTVAFNVASVGITASLLVRQLPPSAGLGPPPVLAFAWVLLAALPVSAMFSALCLALAALARSSKEGQYYLVPVFLITMPLVLLAMSPGFELSLGNSLIPVTGVVLVLRALIEGDYVEALRFVGPVAIVTGICCCVSIRWAVDQFSRETVLFREGERFELGLWLRHLLRDREDTPAVAAAVMCAAMILLIRFFLSLAVTAEQVNGAVLTITVQLVAVLTPAVLMTAILTRSPRKTLLLRWPSATGALAAVGLAVAYHPIANLLALMVEAMYPINPGIRDQVETFFDSMPGMPVRLLAIAVIGPICEEIAFRGFILSGFRRLGRTGLAIVLTSIAFGLTHSIMQQSIVAGITGLLIAYLAVRTGSLLPPVLFHIIHNGLALCTADIQLAQPSDGNPLYWAMRKVLGEGGARQLGTAMFGQEDTAGFVYQVSILVVAFLATLGLLLWLHRQPYQKTEEELLQERLEAHEAADAE